jgi:hypothetical protein
LCYMMPIHENCSLTRSKHGEHLKSKDGSG